MSKYSENMPPSLKGAVEWMIDDIKPKSIFLDFGCSTGYFGKYIKDTKKCRVYGVEISSDREKARKVLDGVYSFDIDGEWPAEIYERKYDYLFYGDVLEHLKYPELALEKSKKLLKSGGKIFVSIPNIAHLSTRLELLAGRFQYEPMGILDNTHLKYFTLKSFNELAESAGYRISKVDYTVDEYPKEVTRNLLKKVGLVPSDKFWDIAKSNEARAFQLKFILEPKKGLINRRTKKQVILPEKPEQYKDNFISDLKQQIKALDDHAKEQAKIIAYKDRLIKDLQLELHKHREQVKKIYNSAPGKLYKTALRAKRKISKK